MMTRHLRFAALAALALAGWAPASLAAQSDATQAEAPAPAAAELPAASPTTGTQPEALAASPSPAPVPLSLELALSAAQANSLTLKLRMSEQRAADAGLREAQSNWWPKLTHNVSASYMTDPPKGISIPAGSLGSAPSTGRYPVPLPNQDIVLVADPEHTYFKVGGDLSWPILTWGKIESAVAIAQDQVRLATLQGDKSSRELKRDLKKAYFGAILSRESTQVLAEMEKLFAGITADRQYSFQQGAANQESVYEAQGRLASIHTQRIRAEQGYRTALAGLRYLAGLGVDDLDLVTPLPDQAPPLDAAQLLASARTNSVERAIVESQYDMAKKARDIAFNTDFWRPDIGLNIKLDITGQRIPFTANWTDTWNADIIFSIGTQLTMFDGGKQIARTDQATERMTQASIGLSMIDQGLPAQVQRLVEAAAIAQATLNEKQSAQVLAVERDRNAQSALANEMATREDAQGARIALMMARLEGLTSRFSLVTCLVDLEYLTLQDLF